MDNGAWVIAKPSGEIYSPDCLRWEAREVPSLAPGELILRTVYLSIDPSMRNALTLKPNTAPFPIKVGDVVTAGGISVVEQSAAAGFSKGDIVVGATPWQKYSSVPAGRVRKVKPDVPLEANLTVFSIIGYAATAGIIGVGQVKASDTVVVSAAAGATGSIAAQLAKAAGARVIGIAGGEEKRRYLLDELGLDGAIDYKSDDMDSELGRLCPEGVSLFFDNVGGAVLDAVLMHLAVGARIAVCGQIALYNSNDRNDGQGVRNLMQLVFRTATMQGFFAGQPADRMPEYEEVLLRNLRNGTLKARSHIIKGLERAPSALDMLLKGENNGKLLIEVSSV